MDFLFSGPPTALATIALAHGAGAGMDTPFLAFFAEGLAAAGIRVARFEFSYMAQRRQTGKQRPPDREPVLRETWLAVIEQLGARNLVIGGKSMGGRIASLVADEAKVAGLVCLGYPFHPVGNPEELRVEHLGKAEDADADRAGRARSLRHQARRDGVRVFRGHPDSLAAGGTTASIRARGRAGQSGRTEKTAWTKSAA